MRRYPARNTTPTAGGSGYSKRDRAAQHRFRTAIINRDGLKCWTCAATNVPLQAHHTSPTDGRLLCGPCHREVDDHAR